ncbi:MAG: ECF transporter S component [Ruminococcus sp.]|nr:ECF transporter S component [Ruminococcus sp.]
MNNTRINIRSMAQAAMFTALIFVLAFVPYIGYIKIPVLAIQATTVHIPVIVGSILLGPKYGGFLGGMFGLTSLINNTMSPGITSFCFSPFVEIGDGAGGSPLALIVCFVPRILVGIVPYYVYTLIQSRAKDPAASNKISLMVSGVAGSMTNTILVMSMIYIFFGHEWADAKDMAYSKVLGVILSVVAINGTIEAIVAALITSAVIFAFIKAKLFKPYAKK